ncbi:MAG TPA: hypothetical protein VMW19_19305 [Myxococcota bacterium]|nr:hypothetical protein [Myxococcota bacterium]
MRSLRLGLVSTGLFFALGCSTTLANLDVVSTKTTDFSQAHHRSASQASDTDGRLWITILPLGGAPSIDKAMNNLLEKYNGDYLTDAKVSETWWSLLLVSYGAIEVKGDVWSAGAGASSGSAPTAK